MNENIPSFFRLSVEPWGLLMAVGVVACSATVFGFLGRFFWFLDLFSHFRVQYFISLFFLGFVLLLSRHRKIATVFIAFACINLGVVFPMYVGSTTIPQEAKHTFRAMLLNVNTQTGDPKRVKQVIQEVEPDILVLEEISSQWLIDLQWLSHSHSHSRVQPREDNFGIGLFSKFPLAEDKVVSIGDAGVPSIIGTVDTGQGKVRVIATHPLPPIGAAYSRLRNEQLDRLYDYINSSVPLILLGDLNVTPWNYYFKRLLRRTGLINSSKGRGIQPTWPSFYPISIPIDHCLHSPDVSVVSRTIGADVGSDHYPVIVDLVITNEQDK